jgi:hypothetical protein
VKIMVLLEQGAALSIAAAESSRTHGWHKPGDLKQEGSKNTIDNMDPESDHREWESWKQDQEELAYKDAVTSQCQIRQQTVQYQFT